MCLTQACAAQAARALQGNGTLPYTRMATEHQEPSMYERAIPADPPRLWEHPYPGTTDQVRYVRAAVRELLGESPVADDAVHLLSELSANAIAYSDSGKRGGKFTVRVQHFPGNYVWGE